MIEKLGVALMVVALSIGSTADAQVAPVSSLSVDMPHGGCRLTVTRDGAASIHFGALPKWVRVDSGTFDFDGLANQLREKSYPQGDRKAETHPVGSLLLPASNDLLLIADDGLVRSLLERGWQARVPPTTRLKIEDHQWMARACSLR